MTPPHLFLKTLAYFLLLIGGIIITGLSVSIFWVTANTPGHIDREKARYIVQNVEYQYHQLKNHDPSKGPTIYMRPHPNKVEVHIYGVTDGNEQERIILII